MTDQTPEARLTAALATSAWVIQAARLWAQPTTTEQLAAQIAAHLAADPTLDADLALAAAVRGAALRGRFWCHVCGYSVFYANVPAHIDSRAHEAND